MGHFFCIPMLSLHMWCYPMFLVVSNALNKTLMVLGTHSMGEEPAGIVVGPPPNGNNFGSIRYTFLF